MKRMAVLFAALAVGGVTLTGCEESPEVRAKREAYYKQQEEARRLQAEAEAKVCRVMVHLKQSRFSLDLTQHAKDALNDAKFPLPTSCEKVSQLKAGDNIVDKFRTGSFLVSGSLGSWKMNVDSIPAVAGDADKTKCRVRIELSQSRVSLDLMQHLKDAVNDYTFDWEMPGNVYHASREGQDFADDGFRVGSLLMRGSFGSWNLKLKQKLGCTP